MYAGLSVEVLPPKVERRYRGAGYRFLNTEEVSDARVQRTLSSALDLICDVPELAQTVGTLARKIHILAADNDAYDVSFSDPALPFSIFISVPSTELGQPIWRTAEALIHETAHLQLSLVERLMALVDSTHEVMYSPWKSSMRPLGGVLHGLYVFGVIADWLAENADRSGYARARLIDIAVEAAQVRTLASCVGLTVSGAGLARNALDHIRKASLALRQSSCAGIPTLESRA